MDIGYYVFFYIIFGFLGFLWEWMIGAQHSLCGDSLVRRLGFCIPFLNIYAAGGVMVLLLRKVFTNPFYLALAAGILLTVYECTTGKMNEQIYGLKEWDYGASGKFGVACSGYICFEMFLLWTFFAFIIDIGLKLLKL